MRNHNKGLAFGLDGATFAIIQLKQRGVVQQSSQPYAKGSPWRLRGFHTVNNTPPLDILRDSKVVGKPGNPRFLRQGLSLESSEL